MGSTIRVNDTLQITAEQGFPAALGLARQLESPLSASHFAGETFSFWDKEGVRNFQQPPVLNFLVENRAGKHISPEVGGLRGCGVTFAYIYISGLAAGSTVRLPYTVRRGSSTRRVRSGSAARHSPTDYSARLSSLSKSGLVHDRF